MFKRFTSMEMEELEDVEPWRETSAKRASAGRSLLDQRWNLAHVPNSMFSIPGQSGQWCDSWHGTNCTQVFFRHLPRSISRLPTWMERPTWRPKWRGNVEGAWGMKVQGFTRWPRDTIAAVAIIQVLVLCSMKKLYCNLLRSFQGFWMDFNIF